MLTGFPGGLIDIDHNYSGGSQTQQKARTLVSCPLSSAEGSPLRLLVLSLRAVCLPTFSNFLIVNKTSLSLSLSLSCPVTF